MPEFREFADGLFFPEAPRWQDGYLWVADIHGRVVRRYTEDGVGEDYARLDTEPAGLGFAPDGTLLAVDMPGRRLLSVTPDKTELVADLSDLSPSFCNDLVVGADGTAYVTQLGFNYWKGEEFRAVPVMRVCPDGATDAIGPDLAGPNGIVLTADQRTLLVAEPGAGRVAWLRLDEEGEVSGHGVHVELPPAPGSELPFGTPDGICLDSEGGLWIADPTGNRVVRVGADGEFTDNLPILEGIPLSVVLGGALGRTLFIAVGSHADFYAPREDPKGRVVAVDVTVPGL